MYSAVWLFALETTQKKKNKMLGPEALAEIFSGGGANDVSSIYWIK